MHAIVLAVHSAIGAVALCSFWAAGLARKGSGLHRRAGRIYLAAMAAILLTALPLSLSFFGRGDTLRGSFFLYLLVLVGTSVVIAPRAVRLKRDFAAFRGGSYPYLAGLQLAAGAATVTVGLWARQPLLAVFGSVGVALSLRMLHLRGRPQAPAGWWLREHFTAMIGNGVATHVAFLSIGLPHLLAADVALRVQALHLAWFGPLAAALAAGTWLNIRHRRRFCARRPGSVATYRPAANVAAAQTPR
jgi:uncharacterized membrane protein